MLDSRMTSFRPGPHPSRTTSLSSEVHALATTCSSASSPIGACNFRRGTFSSCTFSCCPQCSPSFFFCSLAQGGIWISAITQLLINTVIYGLFVTHMGWFCVIKSRGCCGRIGYLLWAIFYVITALVRSGYVNVFVGYGVNSTVVMLIGLANLLA